MKIILLLLIVGLVSSITGFLVFLAPDDSEATNPAGLEAVPRLVVGDANWSGGNLVEVSVPDSEMPAGERYERLAKFDFRFTVTNQLETRQVFRAKIQWLDQQGYELANSYEYNLALLPGETETFTGFDLLDSSMAERVERILVSIPYP